MQSETLDDEAGRIPFLAGFVRSRKAIGEYTPIIARFLFPLGDRIG
jgi:hypothetical protein